MKKSLKFYIIIIIIIILLIPIPRHLMDGGTVEYNALTYSIIKVHKLNDNLLGSYDKGLIIKLFGHEIYKNVQNSLIDQEENSVLSIDSPLIKNLYNSVQASNDALVLKHLYTEESFDNDYILAVGMKNYLQNQNTLITTVSTNDLKKNVQAIFGKDINFHNADFYLLFDNYCGFNYDAKNEVYNIISGCDGDMFNHFYRQIDSAEKENNLIKIREKSLYVYNEWDENSSYIWIYDNLDKKNLIDSFAKNLEEDYQNYFDVYKDKASTYEYVFEKEEDNYIFKYIKRVN